MLSADRNTEVGESVAHLISDAKVAVALAEATERAMAILDSDPQKLAGTIPLDIGIFGNSLPQELRSCRLSVMRAGAAYHVERHPNAVQYVYSLNNSGSISIFDGNNWRTTELTSNAADPLVSRWHIVPPNAWHQPVPGVNHWTVLGFHSVPSTELIDDYSFNGPKKTI
jgi:hypothetical protein